MANGQIPIDELLKLAKGTPIDKKTSGLAKTASIAILVVIFGVGIAGAFLTQYFSMDAYVKFLEVAMWPLLLLLFSIGTSSVVSSVKGKETKTEEVPPEVKK